MKMSKESYNEIVEVFQANIIAIEEHKNRLIESGDYKKLEIRLGWDALSTFIGTKTICNTYYNQENLTDTHITTATSKALKELGIV